MFTYFSSLGLIPYRAVACELHAIADAYELPLLKERTERIIFEDLHDSNALEAYRVGHIVNNENLINAAFDIIRNSINVSDDRLISVPESLQLLVKSIRSVKEKIDGDEEVVEVVD
jgi:hypothetical protein